MSRPELFGRSFDALRVGDSFTCPPRVLGDEEVRAFAELSGDRHPLHLDDDWAATSQFGQRIAHGLLVLSAAAGSLPFDPSRVVALRRLKDVVFKAPLVVGDSVTADLEVLGHRTVDAQTGLVECGLRAFSSEGRLAMRATIEILWRRDADDSDA